VKIGIVGARHISATAARLFVGAGHEVAISNSRGPDTLRDLVATRDITVADARAMAPRS
jgi:predicted dinucleotide-binding enzyme